MTDEKINKITRYVGIAGDALHVAKVKLPNVLKNTGKKIALGFSLVMLAAEICKVVVTNFNKQDDEDNE